MPKPSKALTRQREELAWELSAQGLSERKIALELEKAGLERITQQGVSAMLIRVEARALKEMAERVGGLKAKQTQALWHIYQEAMDAWRRSQQSAKSVTKHLDGGAVPPAGESGRPALGGGERVTTQIRDQDGDPRFLDQARAALADLRKIWGLDAPHKVAPTTPAGDRPFSPELTLVVQGMTDEELLTLERIAERHREVAGGAGGSRPNGAGGA